MAENPGGLCWGSSNFVYCAGFFSQIGSHYIALGFITISAQSGLIPRLSEALATFSYYWWCVLCMSSKLSTCFVCVILVTFEPV